MAADLMDLKVKALEERQDLDRLVALYEQFQGYVKILAEALERGAVGTEFIATLEALRLRLADEEHRFLEWHDGERVLNAGIYGLTQDWDTYFHDQQGFRNDLLVATAKFEHLIQNRHRSLRELHEKIALLSTEKEAKDLTRIEQKTDSTVQRVKNGDQVAEIGLKWAGRVIEFGGWAAKVLKGLGLL